MRWRFFKYLSPFIVFFLAFIAFTNRGWLSFLPVLWSFGCIPFFELFLTPSSTNISLAEEELVKDDPIYDYLLYATLVLQYIFLCIFLFSMQTQNLGWVTIVGRISSMGLLCGIMGINVGHELGHRKNKAEQFMAKLLLLSSQYLHFFIEHNKGHHKHVATSNDPASARLGESLFMFYPRTILGSYCNAWSIANKEVKIKRYRVIGIHNEMVLYTLIQLLFCLLILYFFGITIFYSYLAAAFIGIGLLETVNYIEHYGLHRIELSPGIFERAMPKHSWNSNHVLGRMMLFELSRHSDHHYLASRKYQVLRHFYDSPQMPTGYPGMMILAHLPPLFFHVMDKRKKLL